MGEWAVATPSTTVMPARGSAWSTEKKLLVGVSIGMGALLVLVIGAIIAGIALAGVVRFWAATDEPVTYESEYGYSAVFPGHVWDCTDDGYQTYDDTLATQCSENARGDFMDVDVFEGGRGYYGTVQLTYEGWSDAVENDPAFRGWEVSRETRTDGTEYVLMYGPGGKEGRVLYNVWIEGSDYEYVLYFGSVSRDLPLEDVQSLLSTFEME